jgi:hypothetical protein
MERTRPTNEASRLSGGTAGILRPLREFQGEIGQVGARGGSSVITAQEFLTSAEKIHSVLLSLWITCRIYL